MLPDSKSEIILAQLKTTLEILDKVWTEVERVSLTPAEGKFAQNITRARLLLIRTIRFLEEEMAE